MRTIAVLTKRNTLMFVKNKGALFFSLLSVLVTLGLYIVFLAQINIDAAGSIVKTGHNTLEYLVNSWVMGGIIVAGSVTVTLGVLGIMVEDEARNRMPAFLVSPVSRFKLVLSYVLSAIVTGSVLCIITFILSQLYIVLAGGSLLAPGDAVKALLVILASVFSSTCFVFFLVSFIKTISSYTTVSILTGSLIGFVAGIYIPVGSLPGAVQKFIKCMPVFYDSSLMRRIFMEHPISLAFKGYTPEVTKSYLESMGVNISWGSSAVSDFSKTAIVIISGLVFLLLSVLVMNRRKPYAR